MILSQQPVTIFLSAAEASGDEHAAKLIRRLRARLPNARLVGVGGPEMEAAGCEILANLTRSASMAGASILRAAYYMRTVRRLRKMIRRIRPDVHVPVDSPALNWHLAAAAKKIGSAVMYYVSPQVWAWATWRVGKVRRLTDQVACILPFEQRYLRDRGVRATYIGHPVFDNMPPLPDPPPDLPEAWCEGNWQVALLPGSRSAEIRNHAGPLLATAQAIQDRWPRAQCTVCARTDADADTIRARDKTAQADIVVARTHEVLARSHFAVAVSGTVTLEVAHFGVPMVIFYRAPRLGYRIIRHIIRTPHLSLVNILAGRRLVPELMPWHGNVRTLKATVLDMMDDLGFLVETREALLELVEPLHVPAPRTAADNAADLVVSLLPDR